MNEITQSKVSKHHIDLVSKHNLQKATANKLLRFLSHAYNKAIEWNIPHITINPILKLKEYQVNNNKEVFLEPYQIQTLLEVADNYPNKINIASIIRFLLYTGARKNESIRSY